MQRIERINLLARLSGWIEDSLWMIFSLEHYLASRPNVTARL